MILLPKWTFWQTKVGNNIFLCQYEFVVLKILSLEVLASVLHFY